MDDRKKAFPVGIEFFRDFKLKNCYCVDKTAFIAELLRTKGAVNFFTRPRQIYLWSVLYSTGYLTDAKKPEGRIHKLVIPNREIRKIYEDRIRSWFCVKVTGDTKR